MKCFYCGRNYTRETNENGEIRFICKFPRCKAQPCTDFHQNEADCYSDIELIKASWRNAR